MKTICKVNWFWGKKEVRTKYSNLQWYEYMEAKKKNKWGHMKAIVCLQDW